MIVTLDSDFLTSGPGSVRYAREFARKRRVEGPESKMNRLYAVESTPTNTGAMADHRLRMRASDIEGFARALARELGVNTVAGPAAPPNVPAGWIPALARDLKQHPGATLVVAGDQQPPIVHALAHAINQALGNFDKTVYFTQPIEVSPANQWDSIGELAADIRAGSVTTLLILGSNPVYDAPADLGFKEILPKVPFSARLGLYEDETSALCHWHIPQAHELESWGDARGYDGTAYGDSAADRAALRRKIRSRFSGRAQRASLQSRATISCMIIGRRSGPMWRGSMPFGRRRCAMELSPTRHFRQSKFR